MASRTSKLIYKIINLQNPNFDHQPCKTKSFHLQISCYVFINYPSFGLLFSSIILILAFSCISYPVLVLLFQNHYSYFCPTIWWLFAGPPVSYLINMLEKTKHTWFPSQKNTSKTYITDSRNVLLSCALGKVNMFYIHIKISLSLFPSPLSYIHQ